jgi:putative flippase GtrA
MIVRQAASFVFIGVAINAALYAAYLLLTHTLLVAFAAMTVTYCSGVVIGFALNRRFTFRFSGDKGFAFLRYVGAYLVGYLVNLAGLWLLADRCGIPHEIVQGGMIFAIAALLFLLQKYWVFPDRAPYSASPIARPSP